jgi:hypothetical protein
MGCNPLVADDHAANGIHDRCLAVTILTAPGINAIGQVPGLFGWCDRL